MIILGKKTVGRLETLLYANQKFNWNDDWVMGISSYYAFWAWLLARITGRKCIYYCIDYYTYLVRKDFLDGISIWLAAKLDHFLCKHVDIVWDISHRINQGRYDLERFILYRDIRANVIGEPVNMKDYGTPSIVMPLSYPPNYFRFKKTGIPRPVFVGLVPYGKEVWTDNTHWIGDGSKPIENLLDELSAYGIGISVWDRCGNNYYGDPGKTKLYSACGLPVIMTDNTPYAEIVRKTGAGIIVDYTKESIEQAVKKIFRKYSFYKSNVKKTWEYIDADRLLNNIKILER